MKRLLAVGLTALALAACQTTTDTTVATETETVTKPEAVSEAPPPAPKAEDEWARADYDNMDIWLCHPDKANDACSKSQDYTKVQPDGSTEVVKYTAAAEPDVDCFYIYPTLSNDPGANSDLVANDEEFRVVDQQFARFGQTCRLFAPVYRQITLTQLRKAMMGGKFEANMEMRWADIVDSWNHYLENHNNGRGVILVGHSQGSGIIQELLEKEIVGKPIQKQIVSAMPIGITIPVDNDTGLAAGLPLCESKGQTGCMVAYSAFRSDVPPPANSLFGRNGPKGEKAACVNPAILSGDAGVLDARLGAKSAFGSGEDPVFGDGIEVTTPYAAVPGLLTAQCKANDTFSWLDIKVNADPSDPRMDDITGDVITNGMTLTNWGLHLVDVNLAMGNLVRIAETQVSAYTSGE